MKRRIVTVEKETKKSKSEINVNFNNCQFYNSIGMQCNDPKVLRELMKDLYGF